MLICRGEPTEMTGYRNFPNRHHSKHKQQCEQCEQCEQCKTKQPGFELNIRELLIVPFSRSSLRYRTMYLLAEKLIFNE